MMTPNWERIWEARISKGSTPQSQDLSRRPCSTRVTWCIPNSNIPYFVLLLIVKLVSWHCSALLVLIVSCHHWVCSSPSISDLPSISKHISSSIPEPALRWKIRWWEPSPGNISPVISWRWKMLTVLMIMMYCNPWRCQVFIDILPILKDIWFSMRFENKLCKWQTTYRVAF